MADSTISNKVWNIAGILFDGGVSNSDYLEQITCQKIFRFSGHFWSFRNDHFYFLSFTTNNRIFATIKKKCLIRVA